MFRCHDIFHLCLVYASQLHASDLSVQKVDKGPDFWNTSVKDCEPLPELDSIWCVVVHCLTWRAPNLTCAMHFCGADINAAVTPSLAVSFAIALLCAVFS